MQYEILIIEDNLPTIRLLTTYFETKGFRSRGVISGKEGLEELEKWLPKVILLDLTIPDINWYDMVKQIKEKNVPIFLFGNIKKTNVKVRTLMIIDVIPKPFSFEEFDVFLKYASRTVIDKITLWEFNDKDK
ncbi:MAG: PleD family two-component system response regulator [Candidatus Odinarchaeota archaeon]